jgi:uncharacterized protein YndB with AHSA1/START domain
MPRITVSIDVERPPEETFEVVADPALRRRMLPDNFRDYRVESEVERGPGARTSFRIVTPHGDHRSEVEVTDWDPPRSLTEQALGSSPYTMHWRFDPGPIGTHVALTMDYTVEGTIVHRWIERWFARRALQRSVLVELMRLKETAELR